MRGTSESGTGTSLPGALSRPDGLNPSRPPSHSDVGVTRPVAPASGGADGMLSSRRETSRTPTRSTGRSASPASTGSGKWRSGRGSTPGSASEGTRPVNKAWHEDNPMPERPSKDQRIAWHVAHARACACREVPRSIRAEVETVLAGDQRPDAYADASGGR